MKKKTTIQVLLIIIAALVAWIGIDKYFDIQEEERHYSEIKQVEAYMKTVDSSFKLLQEATMEHQRIYHP